MFRSVTESRRLPKTRRRLYRAEGLVVGALVCLLLALGFAWHEQQVVRALGDLITTAGPVVLDDALDFFEFWGPTQRIAGVAAPCTRPRGARNATRATFTTGC